MSASTAEQHLMAAVDFAAAGQHEAALRLLNSVHDESVSERARLLRAKILAQLEQYPEAVREWESVLADDPLNQEASQGIARAQRLQRGAGMRAHRRMRLFRLAAGALAIAAACGVSFWLGRNGGASGARQEGRDEAFHAVMANLDHTHEAFRAFEQQFAQSAESLRQTRESVSALAGRLDTVTAAQAKAESAQAERGDLLDRELKATAGKLETAFTRQSEEWSLQAQQFHARMDGLAAQLKTQQDSTAGVLTQMGAEEASRHAAGQEALAAVQSDFHSQLDAAKTEIHALLDDQSKRMMKAQTESEATVIRTAERGQAELRMALQLQQEMRELYQACETIGDRLFGPQKAKRDELLNRLSTLDQRITAWTEGKSAAP